MLSKKIKISIVCFVLCYIPTLVIASEYDEVGRYQISGNGDYVIDTKTGEVKLNNGGTRSKKFHDKPTIN